jgi:hypothetical protein
VLLAHGADPNARIVTMLPRQGGFDNNYLKLVGATPFLLAAKAADTTLMRLLAENGANPLLPTDEHTTPLMVAAGLGYVIGQSVGSESERLEAVRLALASGADIHAQNHAGETALHGAAASGANAVVRFLVAEGARLDVANKEGWTPLKIAEDDPTGTTGIHRVLRANSNPGTAALIRELSDGARK